MQTLKAMLQAIFYKASFSCVFFWNGIFRNFKRPEIPGKSLKQKSFLCLTLPCQQDDKGIIKSIFFMFFCVMEYPGTFRDQKFLANSSIKFLPNLEMRIRECLSSSLDSCRAPPNHPLDTSHQQECHSLLTNRFSKVTNQPSINLTTLSLDPTVLKSGEKKTGFYWVKWQNLKSSSFPNIQDQTNQPTTSCQIMLTHIDENLGNKWWECVYFFVTKIWSLSLNIHN